MRSVRITSEGGVARRTKVWNADGSEIKGVTAIDVRVRPDDYVSADIRFHLSEIDTEAVGRFVTMHPETGELAEVQSITFADGTTVTF